MVRKKEKLVSVIMPTYNVASFVEESYQSLKAQKYLNWELIVVDDCSKDSTLKQLNSIQTLDSRVTVVSLTKNVGCAEARNIAIQKAKGSFIAFLDADDLWEPSFLSSQLTLLESSGAVLACSSFSHIDERSKSILEPLVLKKGFFYYKDLLRRNFVGASSAVYSVEKIGKVYLDASLGKTKHDYSLWLDILKKGCFGVRNPEVLMKYRVHAEASTSKKWRLLLPHVKLLYLRQKLNLFQSLYFTFLWAVRGVFKFYFKKVL